MARKKPHPARSARIVITGLSATAAFGMLGGYAYAERRNIEPPNPAPTAAAPATEAPGEQVPVTSPLAPTASAPSTPRAATAAPKHASTKPATTKVVEVPAPAPAQPGTGGSAGNTQRSSGSN